MSPELAARRTRVARRLNIAALVWSVGLVVAAVLIPAYDGHTEAGGDGLTVTKATLVVENGAWVLIPVAVPALVCVFVVFALRRKAVRSSRLAAVLAWVAIALLCAFALLLILSIGGYFLPVVILLALAARLTPPRTAIRERS